MSLYLAAIAEDYAHLLEPRSTVKPRTLHLRKLAHFEGVAWGVQAITRRPRNGAGLWCILEHPKHGLRIARYADVARSEKKHRKQNRSPGSIAQVPDSRSGRVEIGNAV